MTSFDLKVQLLMIGDSGVGKTSLIDRYSSNSFTTEHIASIGVDFKIRMITVEGKKVKLQIWDTAGQERFRSITNSFYRRAEGILLVYDVTDRNSFAAIHSWIHQIEENTDSEAKIDMVLVGNKSDRPERKVTRDEGAKLAKSYKLPFFETSAKNGDNVVTAYNQLAETVTRRMLAETKRSGSTASTVSSSSGNSSGSSGGRVRLSRNISADGGGGRGGEAVKRRISFC